MIISDSKFHRVWSDYTRMVKHPIRGQRILGKGGLVMEYNGDSWVWLYTPDQSLEVAVLSTKMVYRYDGKSWRKQN